MESVHPPAGSQLSRVPAQRTPPGQVIPEPGTPPPAPRQRRLGVVLAVVGAVVTFLCLGGAAAAYLLYDNYTAPDRSAPDVTVDNYLRAFLVDRNDLRADQYTCDNAAGLAELQALRSDLQAREARFNTHFVVKWGPLAVTAKGDTADVQVTLSVAAVVDNVAHTSRETWVFTVVSNDDWQVCSARRSG